MLDAGLGDDYEIIGFDREEGPRVAFVVDLAEAAQVRGIFEGLDAVVHLAADPDPGAEWSSVRDNNIEATYRVFEECRNSGVERIVFATTNHTQHGDTIATTPETLDPEKKKASAPDRPPQPRLPLRGFEAVRPEESRQVLQRAARTPLHRPAHRLDHGSQRRRHECGAHAAEEYMRAMHLSHRDCVQAFRRALEVDTRFLLAYAISANDRRVFDLGDTVDGLGFLPRDNAETDF